MTGPLGRPAPHESAVGHVTGRAVYTDDLQPPGCLHGVVVPAPVACGRLLAVHTAAAAAMDGVVCVLTAADVPGDPLIGPIVHDEPVLATDRIRFKGQAVAVVFAPDREQARRAAEAVRVEVAAEPAVLGIDAAVAAGAFHTAPHIIARGEVQAALDRLATDGVVVEGEVRVPGQDHFYLETHAALALPQEDGDLCVVSSTQHPTECQRMVARVLGIGEHRVRCEVPRMGGGFGGKESQATAPACLAALGARATGRPAKVWLERHEDMGTTGGRHPFLGRYRAGFRRDGTLEALDVQLFSDGGWTSDLSGPVMDRALFHLDNAYFVEHLRFEGRVCRTDQPSSTAFRGFGGPQGMVVVEDALRRGARALGVPPEQVRRQSYYRDGQPAPYGQVVPAPRIAAMHERLADDAGLAARREVIAAHNAASPFHKRGLGLMPIKFGISFTNSLLNQAGALVLVYADGTVQLNHGGTEMGQGLHTKMVAVCADTLGVHTDAVRQMRTSTDKVPNTSPTAASSGSDLNGAAVLAACTTIRERMRPVAAGLLGVPPETLWFADGAVHGPGGASLSFADLAKQCWLQRVSLASTGFYATPGIAYDAAAGRGTPFFYFAYGIAAVEVELCGLTGEQRLRRVDILHDVGDSLVPTIDRGQIEGGFVQGLGWLTDEQVVIGPDGGVRTLGPSTYKVPAVGDVPLDFRVQLLDRATEPGVVGGSKAVGEPPFMLAIAVLEALEAAVAAFGDAPFELRLPAHPEHLLRAVEQARGHEVPA
ncbi:MAG: xanthine dehydrogenase molybdopterin binding subunit [Alphaproteobacteria bacterium]|nr:xanthine dehydrogenase molybdopterin binding subunit [Alphaproteobacteria bacterium]